MLQRIVLPAVTLLLLVLVPLTVFAAFVVGWLDRPVTVFGTAVHPWWAALGVIGLLVVECPTARGDALVELGEIGDDPIGDGGKLIHDHRRNPRTRFHPADER